MSFLQDLLRIKAEKDRAATEEAQRRQEALAAEAAARAKRTAVRKQQFDALLARWDEIVQQHLTAVAEAMDWADVKPERTFSSSVDEGAILKRDEFDISWRVNFGSESFGVALHFKFDRRDKMVPIKFVVSGARGETARVEQSALKDALTKVFRAGPYREPSPSRSSWEDLNIGGSPLS